MTILRFESIKCFIGYVAHAVRHRLLEYNKALTLQTPLAGLIADRDILRQRKR
jgi:hypothetical protein